MTFFTSEHYSSRIIRIKGVDTTASYLVCGDNKNCLIDTGMGAGSLRTYIEKDLGKKVDFVILTHGHLDHCGGIYEFTDLPIYLNSKDIELGNDSNKVENRFKSLSRQGVDIKDVQPNIDFSITKQLSDGDEFDLGGITLQAIYTPGHTHGMTMILMKEERTILFGDGCGVGVLLFLPYSTSVEEYLETLKNLKTRENEYDKIIRNHGTCESQKDLLDNVIECCELILQRKDDKADIYDALPNHKDETGIYYAKAIDPKTHNRLDGKFGNIAYSENKIFKKQ